MRTTSKCQVTLPQKLREAVGIRPRQKVETFLLEHDGRPVIGIAPAANISKGEEMASRWVGSLHGQGTTDKLLLKIRGRK